MRDRTTTLREIQALDPEQDYQRIALLSGSYDFPQDVEIALALAFFRTFAIPSIAALLDATGQFERAGQKRYDDTTLLLAEFLEHGLESERGRAAIRRINRLHGVHGIANEDFLYVLTTFIFEPIRWNARFGWRPYTDAEKRAHFLLWRRVGELMGIAELPASYEAMEAFNLRFEARHFRRTPASERLGKATLAILADRLPGLPGLRPLVFQAMFAVLDAPLRRAMGFPDPARLAAWLVPALLRLRALALRYVWPARQAPFLATRRKTVTYPDGYTIEALGYMPAQRAGRPSGP
jgi:hypothetical protein